MSHLHGSAGAGGCCLPTLFLSHPVESTLYINVSPVSYLWEFQLNGVAVVVYSSETRKEKKCAPYIIVEKCTQLQQICRGAGFID